MRKFLLALAFPSLFLFATSCDLVDQLKDENDLDKVVERLSNEWAVDQARSTEYGFVPGTGLNFEQQNPIGRDTLLPVIKLKFIRDAKAIGYEGTVVQTNLVKGVESTKEYRWRYNGLLSLLYPSPNPGSSDVEIIYTVVELTDTKLEFSRDENLISNTNGAKYGSLKTNWKLHK